MDKPTPIPSNPPIETDGYDLKDPLDRMQLDMVIRTQNRRDYDEPRHIR